MEMDRREFLKAAAAAGCLGPLSGISTLASAAEPVRERPLLVALFLRGGADGLNLVGPSADPEYVAARPPELRVADGGERAGIVVDKSLDPASGFRWHPDAAPLAALYRGGRLAVVHAVGLADGTRSHFVAQGMMERGVADEKRGILDSGWLGRACGRVTGPVRGYTAGDAADVALRGAAADLAAPDVSAGLGIPYGAPSANLIRAMSMTGDGPAHRAGIAALDVLEAVDRRLPRDAGGRVLPYQPAGHAAYDGAGPLERPLASLARLARMDVGLAAACVDHGGWDTHQGQPGRFSHQVKELSAGLSAFHEDMAAAGHKAVTVVMTEFGRRFRSNRSNGTDHGHGACWLVLGDGVRGGAMYGRWPGLATARLDHGVDLAVTTDYRAVLAETLAACGLAADASFPGFKAERNLGLFVAG